MLGLPPCYTIHDESSLAATRIPEQPPPYSTQPYDANEQLLPAAVGGIRDGDAPPAYETLPRAQSPRVVAVVAATAGGVDDDATHASTAALLLESAVDTRNAQTELQASGDAASSSLLSSAHRDDESNCNDALLASPDDGVGEMETDKSKDTFGDPLQLKDIS